FPHHLTHQYLHSFPTRRSSDLNEMAKLCERMGLNAWEITEAAKTKPFGFLAHYPSAGVGGHCILVDPYYLSCAAREFDLSLGFRSEEHTSELPVTSLSRMPSSA